jgi:hypothetical protein
MSGHGGQFLREVHEEDADCNGRAAIQYDFLPCCRWEPESGQGQQYNYCWVMKRKAAVSVVIQEEQDKVLQGFLKVTYPQKS